MGAGPVFGDGVFGRKGADEMISIVFANILDTKIINN